MSVLTLAATYDVDLEAVFLSTMQELATDLCDT